MLESVLGLGSEIVRGSVSARERADETASILLLQEWNSTHECLCLVNED